MLEPGDIFVSLTGTDGTYSPLTAGDYTYEFRDVGANDIARGSFTVVVCPALSRIDMNCSDAGVANGSFTFTFLGALPETITLNGNSFDVTGNPFTISGLGAGNYSVSVDDTEGLPITIETC